MRIRLHRVKSHVEGVKHHSQRHPHPLLQGLAAVCLVLFVAVAAVTAAPAANASAPHAAQATATAATAKPSPQQQFVAQAQADQNPDLQHWAVATLTQLAKDNNVPVTNAVTQQHVVALVTWAQAEGGGIQGHCGKNNPLNQKGTDFGGVPACGYQTVNYPDLDSGVKGTVQMMEKPQYSRIATALTNPNTSADDFFAALADPGGTPGNSGWSANDPSHKAAYQALAGRVQASWSQYATMTLD